MPVRLTRSWPLAMAVTAALAFALPGCAADAPDGPTLVRLVDYKVELTSTPVHTGTNTFVVSDDGSLEHELVGFKIDGPVSSLALNADGNLDEDALTSVTDGPDLAPGSQVTRSIELTEPGTYLFVCNLPGHFKKGMYTVVTLA